jgi:integrase
MNTLREGLNNYLEMRRALGFKLRRAGKALFDFVSFLESRGAAFITVDLALEWARQPDSAKASTWAEHLGLVRGFARYRKAIDARTEVPPLDLLPHRVARARPYLYSETEIEKLLQAALDLPRTRALKKMTYYYLLGLLAVSGMRIGEALSLRLRDVDLNLGILTIDSGKCGKSRLIPLHNSTKRELSKYVSLRAEFPNGRTSDFFFINLVGKRLDSSEVRRTFYKLSRKEGLRGNGASSGPRLHDLRHRFAVETLVRWYHNGDDVEQRLPILSTFLGHVHVSDTYWYLTTHPELMNLAVNRLEQRWEVVS